MKFFRFLAQKKDASFSKFIFSRLTVIKAAGYFVLVPYYVFLLQIERGSVPVVLGIFASAYVLVEFLLVPILNFFTTQHFSRKLRYWRLSRSDEKSRTELYKALVRYPLRKAVLDYCCFLVFFVCFSSIFDFFFEVNIYLLVMMNLFMGFIAYLLFLMIYKFADSVCSEIGVALVRDGLSEREIERRKFFGLSLRSLFVMYVVVPIFFASIIIFLVSRILLLPVEIYNSYGNYSFAYLSSLAREFGVHKSYGFIYGKTVLAYILTTALFNVGATFMANYMFVSKIIGTSQMMNSVEEELRFKNISKVSLLPTDLSSELSYSLYLINRTVLMFKALLARTAETNGSINGVIAELASSSIETSTAAERHLASMGQIFSGMENVGKLSLSIEENMCQTISVLGDTIGNVYETVSYLNRNVSVLKEITEINENTIYGIESLHQQLAGIGDVANLINSLAAQIKIIALNADLEASSLSDERNTFGPVVHEIRDFADKTIGLTQKMLTELAGIEETSNALVTAGTLCTAKIRDGNKTADRLVRVFGEMDRFLRKASAETVEVRGYVLEQKEMFGGITRTVKAVSEDADKFSQAVRDLHLAIEKLHKDSDALEYLGRLA